MVNRSEICDFVIKELERVNSQHEVFALGESGTYNIEPVGRPHPTDMRALKSLREQPHGYHYPLYRSEIRNPKTIQTVDADASLFEPFH